MRTIDTIAGSFTLERAKRFAKEYNKAKSKCVSSFWFMEHEYQTNFAKYLVEYLTNEFKQELC